jgi:sulfoxide reductase heme-binding subunit YedZ
MRPAIRPAVHLAAALPLGSLVLSAALGRLGANPIEELTLRTGDAAIWCLLATLACSPARRAFGWTWALQLRRPLGLWSFFYASLHLLVFVGADYGFRWEFIREGVLEKPFALAGLAALFTMLPLALTSTRGWIRRLGKGWKRLHRLVYLSGALAGLHVLWQAKAGDVREGWLYGAAVLVLLAARLRRRGRS